LRLLLIRLLGFLLGLLRLPFLRLLLGLRLTFLRLIALLLPFGFCRLLGYGRALILTALRLCTTVPFMVTVSTAAISTPLTVLTVLHVLLFFFHIISI